MHDLPSVQSWQALPASPQALSFTSPMQELPSQQPPQFMKLQGPVGPESICAASLAFAPSGPLSPPQESRARLRRARRKWVSRCAT